MYFLISENRKIKAKYNIYLYIFYYLYSYENIRIGYIEELNDKILNVRIVKIKLTLDYIETRAIKTKKIILKNRK